MRCFRQKGHFDEAGHTAREAHGALSGGVLSSIGLPLIMCIGIFLAGEKII